MGEVDLVGNRVTVRRIHRNEFIAFAQFQVAANLQIGARASLLADPRSLDQVYERLCTSIENGELQIIQLHDRIIDPRPNEGREQVLGRGDEHASLHQAGCIANPREIPANGLDFKTIEVHTTEYNPRPGWSGQNAHVDWCAAVQSDTGTLHRSTNCVF